jgi:hypothetical protein
VPAAAVVRTRLFAVPLAAGAGALVAATLPGSASPLVSFLGKVARFLTTNLPEVSVHTLMAAVAALLWVSALVVVRRRRVG